LIYVVGSGPAGVACAEALVARGCAVTMIDAGIQLEQDRQAVVSSLGSRAPSDWDRAELARIRQPSEASDRTIPLKAAYGSLFPYRAASGQMAFEYRGVDASPSFARGGLSNVWGATILPYHPRDLRDWPIDAVDLAPHYAAAARLMRVSERSDRLAAEFPLASDGSRVLEPSRQAAELTRDLEANAAALEADGWSFGYSRLAVVGGSPQGERGCVYCGLCLYGCPYGLIYNSAAIVDRLREHRQFTYRPDMVVMRVEDRGGGVRIHATQRTSGDEVTFDGDRVCLAAGVFNTTAIVLASLDAYDTPLPILDSLIFLLPLLRYRGVRGVAREALHTLSQIFIEIANPSIAAETIHLQVYTYNDWYTAAMRRRLGALLSSLTGPLLDRLLGRLLAVQGYLPSTLSPPITATLRRDGRVRRLVLEAGDTADAARAIRRIVKSLGRHSRDLRARPLTPLLEIGTPGRGYHSGGAFPMRTQPGRFESDRWGRVHGFERVHAVDSTVFPSIPAAPITFTVAANAHRIGSALATA
jgi:choline dehydrogenase-like flavoprotein